jgi:hypothetical protein
MDSQNSCIPPDDGKVTETPRAKFQTNRSQYKKNYAKRNNKSNTAIVKKIDPCKWKVSFSGVENAREFLVRVEELAEVYNVQLNAIVKFMPVLLSDIALVWFRTLGQDCDWVEFKENFLDQFEGEGNQRKLKLEILSTSQKQGESASEFILRLMSKNNMLVNPFNDAELIDVATHGLHPNYASVIVASSFTDLRQLMKICCRFESAFVRVSSERNIGSASVRDRVPVSIKEEVNSQNKNSNVGVSTQKALTWGKSDSNTRGVRCYFCGKAGHLEKYCFKKNKPVSGQTPEVAVLEACVTDNQSENY